MKQSSQVSLQQVLIDTYALYLKTQNYHWNVRGPWFHSLHIMFQEHYEELAIAVDEIAERLRQLEVYVSATLVSFGNKTNVKEEDQDTSTSEKLASLIRSHEVVKSSISVAMEHAQEQQDEGTVDMLIQRLKAHDKALWMLRMVHERETQQLP